MTARLATIVPRLLGILIVLLYAWLTWCLSLILLSFRSGPLVSVGLDMRGFLMAGGNVVRKYVLERLIPVTRECSSGPLLLTLN